jgi:hypothetical protein
MEEKVVDINLSVVVHGELMLAQLIFFNNTSDKIFLDNQTICVDNKTRRNVFVITDEQNKKIDYIGMMVKRIVVPEDFISLNPGEKIVSTIQLNDVYKLKKGHQYIIQYSVYHPTYMDEEGFTKIESNKVEVVY